MTHAFQMKDSYSSLETLYSCRRVSRKIRMHQSSTRGDLDARYEMNENGKVSSSDFNSSCQNQMDSRGHREESYHIQEVTTKQRALDVRVFRQFSNSVPAFLKEQREKQEGVVSMTEKEALDHLMKGYDEQGKWINHVSVHERPVQYFASSPTSDVVVGAVDAQIRNLGSLTRIPTDYL